ncbi:hypothetical protein [Lacticaseibacillus suilingensis]|uniref:hypothetical protein n=1 Tax=Lacticaseibacillus suilingensis TaxID=2799577 RepID=UPI0022E94CEF|nr:hypothetical protein [Lacticaseibacillus suilingensis]
MTWTDYHQLIKDLTDFVKAVAPIVVAYITYHWRKKPSAAQRKKKEVSKNGK